MQTVPQLGSQLHGRWHHGTASGTSVLDVQATSELSEHEVNNLETLRNEVYQLQRELLRQARELQEHMGIPVVHSGSVLPLEDGGERPADPQDDDDPVATSWKEFERWCGRGRWQCGRWEEG